jgi:hypothetical protein
MAPWASASAPIAAASISANVKSLLHPLPSSNPELRATSPIPTRLRKSE